MNKNATGIGSVMLKGICFALTLSMVVSLFAAGVFAESGCGEKCICHIHPKDMHPSKGSPTPLSTASCTDNPMIPCDLESSRVFDAQAFILSSSGNFSQNMVGLIRIETDSLPDCPNFKGYNAYQILREKSRSAPIFLQNSSFLI